MVALFNRRVYPVIPQKGSCGASGDLAPLAHLAAVLIGEGEATHRGERLPGKVNLTVAIIMSAIFAIGGTLYAINRLGSFSMAGETS